jgi:hypothetical protein
MAETFAALTMAAVAKLVCFPPAMLFRLTGCA